MCDKPSSGVRADGVYLTKLHSATIVRAELGADLVQAEHLFGELEVIPQVVGVVQVVEDVDDLLLLAQKLLGDLITCLLAKLLGGDLGSFLALLTILFR